VSDHGIDAYIADWNSHDVAAILRHFASGCRYEDAALAIINEGHDQLATFLTRFFHAYPDVRFTKLGVIADDSGVAWEWQMEGTYENTGHNGMAAHGQRISFRGVSMTRYVDGLIVSNSDFWNVATLAAQLGV
jgi:steroid delta-isomerase-like uncharacterized protein